MMGRTFMCTECGDYGTIGLFNPDGWIAEILADFFIERFNERECPKCHGDPISQLPLRPSPPPICPPRR